MKTREYRINQEKGSAHKYEESLISNQYLNSGKTDDKVQKYQQWKWADYNQEDLCCCQYFVCQKDLTLQRNRAKDFVMAEKKLKKRIAFQLLALYFSLVCRNWIPEVRSGNRDIAILHC